MIRYKEDRVPGLGKNSRVTKNKYALKVVKTTVIKAVDKDHFLYQDSSQTDSSFQIKLSTVTYTFFLQTYKIPNDSALFEEVKFNSINLNNSAGNVFLTYLSKSDRLFGKKYLKTDKFNVTDTYYLPIRKSVSTLLNNDVTHDLGIEFIVSYIRDLSEI